VGNRSRRRLFLLSALALFAELALIRWLGCEVRIFAYFKNLILIACFLGFGAGFYRARARARLGASLAVLLGVVAVVALPPRAGWEHGPQIATRALSNFYGSIFMGDLPSAPAVAIGTFLLGLFWTAALFMASSVVLFGYAQRIGADIDAFGQTGRLQAYSWNVAGSLAGILAFALVSQLALPPLAWFLVVLLGTAPFLQGWRTRGAVLAGAALLLVALPPQDGTIWSPYHKLEVTQKPDGSRLVTVNGTGYMFMFPVGSESLPWGRAGVDRWRLPYRLHGHASRVLIVGAGAGNDASAALQAGAQRVVAVEIDPEIYRIGRTLHPDRPYQDPRVQVVIDDARHFVETTRERFDLIVFSHLDAHTALSGYTNIRLDNYIYTVESFRNCRRLLDPGGALFVSFWITQDWVATRFIENLRLAFGEPPIAYFVRDERGVVQAYYIATDVPEIRDLATEIGRQGNWEPDEISPPPPSTDDWPFLFAQRRIVPTPMLLLALPLLALCFVIVGLMLRPERSAEGGFPLDRHFFFLGAAFLLVEVHNVSKLALVFGTTWTVNAWVISGVLLAVLLANFVVSVRPSWARGRVLYGLLFASLIAGAVLGPGTLTALPMGRLWAVLLYTLPLGFAGMVFAASFRGASDAPRALGSNILGSILGGFLELVSFSVGLSGLLYLAVGLYALSWPGDPDRLQKPPSGDPTAPNPGENPSPPPSDRPE
jgi:SAM-dependent methyltransferase